MNDPTGERKPMGMFDAVGLIVGIIIGAGIFRSPHDVANAVAVPGIGIILWGVGALVSLCGALCYAELAASFRTDAGEAEYFTHAFGPFTGWYFTWIQLVCFRTAAAIVSIAYVFAEYANEIQKAPTSIYVTGCILVLSCINALGLRPGKWTQNLLALAKVLALSALVLAGFLVTAGPADDSPISPKEPLALAVVAIMYTYSGWHEAAYIVGDMRQPSRSLPRAMVIGVILVAAIYLAVNLAALNSLGFEALRNSKRFGVAILDRAHIHGVWFAVLVVVVTLGSTNGTILSGSRLFSTVGETQTGYGWLSAWRTRRDAPLAALIVQAAICLAFVALIEFQNAGAKGFEIILAATSPVLWLVFLGAGVALVVLRWREPNRERPFRVPAYPLVATIYILACVFMLYESIEYARSESSKESIFMILLLAAGLPYWWFSGRNASSKRR